MISVFCGEEPHSSRYGRNVTLRRFVQPHDEIYYYYYYCHFPGN
jgi:hypothetical protein